MEVGDTWARAAEGWLEGRVGMVYPMLHLRLCVTGVFQGQNLGSTLGNL